MFDLSATENNNTQDSTYDSNEGSTEDDHSETTNTEWFLSHDLASNVSKNDLNNDIIRGKSRSMNQSKRAQLCSQLTDF